MKNVLKKFGLPLLLLAALTLLAACTQELAPDTDTIDALAWAGPLQEATLGVTAELTDHYAAYFTPNEFRMLMDDFNGSFAGVGIYLDQDEQGRALVAALMPGRPAQAAGLEAGDVILAVDGVETTGYDLEFVQLRLRGEEGVDVNVDMLRERAEGDLNYSTTITRAIIESDSLSGAFLEKRPNIAYINIYAFTERTPQEFYDLLVELYDERELTGLILDLRNNGGGSFGAAMALADFFVAKNQPIVWEKTYGGELCHRSYDGSLRDLPLVCLQNEYTASAAEVLIGALKDYGVAKTVGTISFGKGITQAIEELAEGGGIKYTRSRYYTPLKYDLHGLGIEPDVEVEVPEDTSYEEYFDPDNANNLHMQKALEELDKRTYMNVLR